MSKGKDVQAPTQIRRQLVALVVAVLAPVILLVAATTVKVWALQRDAYQQRFLERVSALRLALDTEFDATIRLLHAQSGAGDLNDAAQMPAVTLRFERLLDSNPAWVTIGLLDADGKPRGAVQRRPTTNPLRLDPETAAQVARTLQPTVSNVVMAGQDHDFLTYVAVPILRQGAFHGTLYVGLDQLGWLKFLQSYPVAEQATLTLNDRGGRIIARTLNNERWAGKMASPSFRQHVKDRAEGTFMNEGLEGQRFYSAFSRSRTAGWVLGTGVPQDDVEAELRTPTAMMAAVILFACIVATLLAMILGRRITEAMTELAATAHAVARSEPLDPGKPLAIEEAESVRLVLHETARQLQARETSRDAALSNEAQARAEAERANVAKDEFLAMLGHELRNPLSAMKSAVTVMGMPQTKPEVQERARNIIARQIRHLTGMVDDLLDVARLNSGKVVLNKKVVDAAQVMRHVIDSFQDAGRCAHLAVEARLQPTTVFADETRLEQIFSNLYDNACKYTPAGGRVQVAIEAQGREACIAITDTGSGISADLLPRMFEVFAQGDRTLDRSQGGLGLGLTVVRRLIDMHGGRVEAASEGTDRGSRFTLWLPLVSAQAALPLSDKSMDATAGRRITVVEDNADNRDLISTLLKLKGHEVSVAVDGPSGIVTILSSRAEVALVDIGLPALDGIEVARRLRTLAVGQRLILVALTGYGGAEDRARALAAGFDAFLVKPFDMGAFDAALAKIELAPAE